MSNENDIELAFQHLDHINDLNVKRIQQESQHLPNDCEGECEWCGDYFPRLVNKACGRCRDKYKLV